MRFWLVLLGLAGCDRVFEIPAVAYTDAGNGDAVNDVVNDGTVDARIQCLVEDFTGGWDITVWEVEDPIGIVQVITENDKLVIRPPSNMPQYNALITSSKRDLTNGFVSVEVSSTVAGVVGDTQFKVLPDVTSGNEMLIFQNATNLGFRRVSAVNGVEEDVIPYSPVTHKFWGIRFIGDVVSFETSAAANGPWIPRHSVSFDFAITQVHVAPVAGTYNSGVVSPGQATFDDLKICPAGAQ